jgi:hypothetical protein
MAKVGDLFVSIGGNVSGLNAALGRAGGMLSSFAGRVASTALGTALGSVISNGINTGIGDAIRAASDLNETVSKTEVLLGANAERAKAFAANLASTGVAGAKDTLNSISSIVTAMTNLGTSTDTATERAMALQQRFADLASQDNADIADVQAAFQSLMSGEIEPLRKFNVFTNLDELRKSGKPLGEAAYDAFMRQTRRAEGDLARTGMSLANLSRAGDIRQGQVSESIGQALQGAAQAFQLFRNNFMSQILAKVQDGTLAKAGEAVFSAVVSIGTILQSVLPFLLDTTFGFIEGLSTALGEIAIVVSAAFKRPMDFIGLVLRSMADTILSVAQYFEKVLSYLGIGSGNNIQGLRDQLQAGMVDNQTALAEAGAPTVQTIADTKARLSAAIATPTIPGMGGTGSTLAQGTQSKTSSFTSLLDGVMATAQEKQIAVLERIDAGIQAIASKGPQGAKSVIEKTSLSTIATPQVAGAF